MLRRSTDERCVRRTGKDVKGGNEMGFVWGNEVER